ncbi:hypothetical protein [Mycoplasmopsis agassizii]|uniref:DUF4209 domain-containing protein n=1 Tax=Mycoplasmopsis agassizii TaxID=33922 RepID=A0ABX4H5N6_9BACT|nr:hypothetical protein [Mycoplasmopsis agassizii]PAF55093.1 hypothetical protein CJF60_00170 [Mycoplasmopsis agassizii]SMC19945.1 hypothetical protein SAMN02745179_00980 [Mycoplasmopsis agassizii]
MNIIDELKIPLWSYDESSLNSSNNFYIENINQKKQQIKDYFSKKTLSSITNMDDFIDYLFIWSIKYLKTTFKNDEFSLSNMFSKIKTDRMSASNFLNKNFREILTANSYFANKYDDQRLKKLTIKMIFKNFNLYKNIISQIENDFGWIIIEYIVYCENYYSKHDNRFSKILKSRNYKKYFLNENLYNTFSMLSNSRKKFVREFLNEKAKDVYSSLIIEIEKVTEDNYPSVWQNLSTFLNMNKNKYFNSIPISEIDYLKRRSHELTFSVGAKYLIKVPIDIDKKELEESISFVKEQSKGSMSNLLFIFFTHKLENNKWISKFVSDKESNTNLYDVLGAGLENDLFFTPSYKDKIKDYIDRTSNYISQIITSEDSSNNLENFLNAGIFNIGKYFNDINSDLLDSVNGFFGYFVSYLSYRGEYEDTHKYECYTLSMFVVTLIERIIRLVFTKIYPESHSRSYTLGRMLKTSNEDGSKYENLLTEVIDINLVKALEYHLLRTQDSKIGMNIRNNLMHNQNIVFSTILNSYLLRIFFLFLSLINSLNFYILKKIV